MSTKTEESDYFDTSGGLINSYQESNPLFWNYNRVRAHYCSSFLVGYDKKNFVSKLDVQLLNVWSCFFRAGRIEFNATGWMWAFQGANIALGIVDDLMKDPEFKQAESVVFSGISVGGVGILNLADYIDEKFKANPEFQHIQVYYFSDCGWNLMDWGCYGDECTGEVSNTKALYRAHKPLLNEHCWDYNYTWLCYWPEMFYSFIEAKDRLMVTQQMYDSQQLPWAGKKAPSAWDEGQTEWAMMRADAILDSMADQGVTNAFVSSCRNHDYSEHQCVYSTLVDGKSLAEYINDFIESGGSKRFYAIDEDRHPEANPTCEAV